jgi:phospholipase/lecithinase/hemolysin
MKNRRFLGFFLAIWLQLPLAAGAIPFSGVYLFGDSLSDVGNVFTLTGGIVPAAPYFNGRFTNGPNYADVLAEGLGLSTLAPSVLGGTNYAAGGARSDSHVIPALDPAFSVLGQYGQYLTDSGGVADPGALYVVWGGNNDIQDALVAADPAGTAVAAANNLFMVIDDLVDIGAEHILVPSVADIGVTPRAQALGPVVAGAASSLSALLNATLDGLLDTIVGADIIRFDAYTLTRMAFADPGFFGLTNSTDACYTGPLEGGIPPVPCPNPEDYLFWDDFHPSAATHAILGDLMVAAVVPEPGTLVLAVVGLFGIGAMRRRPSARAA